MLSFEKFGNQDSGRSEVRCRHLAVHNRCLHKREARLSNRASSLSALRGS
jgi:hypothetical protein